MFFKPSANIEQSIKSSRIGFPSLGKHIDWYIDRLESLYETDASATNLERIIYFLKLFPEITEDRFLELVPHYGKELFSRIYLLLHGNQEAINELLCRARWRVLDENMGDYRQYISNVTEKRLSRNIEKLTVKLEKMRSKTKELKMEDEKRELELETSTSHEGEPVQNQRKL
jgi:hypothetical protein